MFKTEISIKVAEAVMQFRSKLLSKWPLTKSSSHFPAVPVVTNSSAWSEDFSRFSDPSIAQSNAGPLLAHSNAGPLSILPGPMLQSPHLLAHRPLGPGALVSSETWASDFLSQKDNVLWALLLFISLQLAKSRPGNVWGMFQFFNFNFTTRFVLKASNHRMCVDGLLKWNHFVHALQVTLSGSNPRPIACFATVRTIAPRKPSTSVCVNLYLNRRKQGRICTKFCIQTNPPWLIFSASCFCAVHVSSLPARARKTRQRVVASFASEKKETARITCVAPWGRLLTPQAWPSTRDLCRPTSIPS